MKTIKRKATGTLGRTLHNMDSESLAKTRNRMLVAAKIAEGIQARGLNRKEFAQLMGKSESEISDWLSGNRNFTIDTLCDISQVLGIGFINTSLKFVEPIKQADFETALASEPA